jgi:hypothetical protein
MTLIRNHNLKRMNYYIWYIFYSAYWSAYELGEKDSPQGNANYLLTIIFGVQLFTICQFLSLFDINFPIFFLVGICVGIPIFINRYYFLRKKRFKEKFNDFKFLRTPAFKKRRYLLLAFIVLCSVLLLTLSGILRMY